MELNADELVQRFRTRFPMQFELTVNELVIEKQAAEIQRLQKGDPDGKPSDA